MSFEATLHHGSPLALDYTPSGSSVAAGQVVVSGNRPLVAHAAIADGELGALAAGGGVYKVTAGEALAAGDKVYWDDTANKVKKTAETGKTFYHFGFVLPNESAAADGDTLYVQHAPDGSTISA